MLPELCLHVHNSMRRAGRQGRAGHDRARQGKAGQGRAGLAATMPFSDHDMNLLQR